MTGKAVLDLVQTLNATFDMRTAFVYRLKERVRMLNHGRSEGVLCEFQKAQTVW